MGTATMIVLAMTLDAALGEPRWLWHRVPHPAVMMGRVIAALDRRLNRGRGKRIKGALAVLLISVGALAIGAGLSSLGDVVTILAAAILIAQRSLCDHVGAVAAALRLSVADGRTAVARIVGRDTGMMDAAAAARAAIESAAENFSDAVVAPLFWFALAGLPGLVLYKAINTADSMIGHLTDRHRAFGWAAARLDDAMNLVPARATALLIALMSRPRPRWADIARDARQHRSPNAGWPEAAMARGIGVALSGPRAYHGQMHAYPFVNATGLRDPGPAQIDAATSMLWRAWAAIWCVALIWAVLS